MPTDSPSLTVQERIERARAIAAARTPRAAPVPPAAPIVAPAASDTTASGTPRGSMTAQQRLIWDIVRAAQVNGAQDLTRSEIRARWEAQSATRQRDGTVAGRVHELLDKGWLHERRIKRQCSDSRNQAFPVYVPSHLIHAAPAQGGQGK